MKSSSRSTLPPPISSTSGRYRLPENLDSMPGACRTLGELVDAYPICSIEDPLAETIGRVGPRFTLAASATGSRSSATTCSPPTRASQRGISSGVANAVLIKMNQIGTITERSTSSHGSDGCSAPVVSARSGETDDVLADLAVGCEPDR